MFSGIILGIGHLTHIRKLPKGVRFSLQASFPLKHLKLGDSVAVNGCCLTVIAKKESSFDADLSHETLKVTNLGELKIGSTVNLERPLKLSDEIHGHIVQGHVDGMGKISKIKHLGGMWEFVVDCPPVLRKYLISKGSVSVDGISLTVNRLTPKSFTLVIVPHTLQRTNLKAKRVGDRVNLEVDMMAKYIENFALNDHKKPKIKQHRRRSRAR